MIFVNSGQRQRSMCRLKQIFSHNSIQDKISNECLIVQFSHLLSQTGNLICSQHKIKTCQSAKTETKPETNSANIFQHIGWAKHNNITETIFTNYMYKLGRFIPRGINEFLLLLYLDRGTLKQQFVRFWVVWRIGLVARLSYPPKVFDDRGLRLNNHLSYTVHL